MASGGTLDAAHGDPECILGIRSGRFTRAYGPLWLAVAGVVTAAVYFASGTQPGSAWTQMMNRCWTNWACVFATAWAALCLLSKVRKVVIQRKALSLSGLIPARGDFVLSPATAPEVLSRIRDRVARPREFLLFHRIDLALSNLKNIGEVRDVGAVLESQAAADSSGVDSSYTGIRSIIWAVPVLGFLGTVIGLGDAIGSFSAVLGDSGADASGIRDKLAPVVTGLGTAFETTLVALVAALLVQLFSTWVYKTEEDLLDDIVSYTTEHVVSRLKLTDW